MTRPELQDTNPQRVPVRLNTQLNKSLVSYVAAAGAAGAGMLAGALPADAEVVYTPANIPLVINTVIGSRPARSRGLVQNRKIRSPAIYNNSVTNKLIGESRAARQSLEKWRCGSSDRSAARQDHLHDWASVQF